MLPNLIKSFFFSPFRLAFKLAFWATVLVLVAGLIFFLTFDLNDYKPIIEKRVSVFLKQELKIDGDVNLGMNFPRPSIALNDVRFDKTEIGKAEFTIPFDPKRLYPPFASVENLRIGGRRMGDYELPLDFSAGGFEIPELEGSLDDGRMTGKISYLADRLAVDLNVRDLDYKHLAPAVSGGKAKMTVKLESTGRGDQLLRNLHGRAQMIGEEGKIAGNAIQFWTGGLLTSLLGGHEENTDVNCVIADFFVENGIATSKTVIIDTNDATIYGRGTVDFVGQRVNMIFKPKPKSPSLLSLATPVRVSGAFGNVTAVPEKGAMAKTLGGILLGAINPAIAVLPMIERGSGDDNPCLKYIEEK